MPDSISSNGGYTGSGCMVAVYPPLSVARKLTQPGGMDAANLHMTLAFLPTAPQGYQLYWLKSIVRMAARQQAALEGVVGGWGRFNPSTTSDNKPVTVALLDIPKLPEFRQALVKSLDAAGFEVSKMHGFTPHISLSYSELEPSNCDGKVSFPNLSLSVGPSITTFPFTGTWQDTALSRIMESYDHKKAYRADRRRLDIIGL